MKEKMTFVCTLEPFEDDLKHPNNHKRSICGVSNDRINEIMDELMHVCNGQDTYYLRDVVIDWVDTGKLTFNELMSAAIGGINQGIARKMKLSDPIAQLFKGLLQEGEKDED